MGLRGPKKKLPQVQLLQGNPGNRPPPNLGDYLTVKGAPFIPPHLEEDAQACMEVVIASMPDGVYSIVDTYLLAAFASAWATHSKADHMLQDPNNGMVMNSPNLGMMANPWLRIRDNQARMLATLGDRLGLNPKARMGIQIPKDQPRSKFDGLTGLNE